MISVYIADISKINLTHSKHKSAVIKFVPQGKTQNEIKNS